LSEIVEEKRLSKKRIFEGIFFDSFDLGIHLPVIFESKGIFFDHILSYLFFWGPKPSLISERNQIIFSYHKDYQ